MDSISIQCPHCGQSLLSTDPSLIGQYVDCPACEKRFRAQPASSETTASSETVQISCPHCGQQLSTLVSNLGRCFDCPSCGRRFATNPPPGKASLSMTRAIVFMALTCIPYLGLVFLPFAWIFALILHYRCWESLPAQYARTTPGKAVGYLFIPFFNYYWIFPSFWGLAQDCRAYATSRSIPVRGIPVGLGLAYSILFWFLPVPFVGIAVFVVWLLFYLNLTRFLRKIS